MDISNPLYKWLGQISLVVLPTAFAYILGTRRRKALDKKTEAEVVGTELDNIEREMGIYQQMMRDLKATLKKAQIDYAKLEAQFVIIMQERDKCLEEKEKLQIENIEFYRKVQTCKYDECGLKK